MAMWQPVALAIALTFLPVAAYAQADDNPEANGFAPSEAAGPSLECRPTGLRIMAAEVSGARFVCQVSGAPAGESSFAVQAISTADQTQTAQPVCSGTLAGGGGACIGAFIDRTASGLAQVRLAATLQPSGAALGPVVIGPPAPANAASEPIQFYPISEP